MKKILIFIINLYRKFISPMLPPTCKFQPTCSEYSIEAIRKYGVLKGSIKAIYRILRCNPFFKGGIDKI